MRRRRLNPNDFVRLEITLPPIDEQRQIVARIDAVAAKVEEVRNLRDTAIDEALQLIAAVEWEIWNEASRREAPSLESVTAFLSRGRQSQQGDSRHYLIKTQHVQMGRYVPTTLTLSADVSAKVTPEARVQPGDSLIACSAAGCLGRVAFFEDSGVEASTDTHVAIARPDRDRLLPEYLFAYLRSAPGQMELRSREQGDWKKEKVSFRLAELNMSDLRNVPVPTPPLSEQRRILERLAAVRAPVETAIAIAEQTSRELESLLPAVLDRAFRGEL